MFCPKCGKEQYDNAAFCHVCGAALIPEQKPAVVPQPIAEQSPVRQAPAPMPNPEPPVEVKAEKKRFKKLPILIGAAALLLVLAIGAGLFFLLRKPAKQEGPRTVRQDMEYAAQEAGAYLRRLPNLNRMLENLDAIEQSGGAALDVDLGMDMGFGKTDEQVRMAVDFNNQRAKLDMTVGLGESNQADPAINLQLYLDPDQLQIGSEELFGDQVYSLLLENLEERWKNSALGQMIGTELPAGMFNINLLNVEGTDTVSPEKIEAALERLYGADWVTFRDSVKLEPCEAPECFAGQGACYTLVWDHDSIAKLGPKAEEALKDREGILSGLIGMYTGFNRIHNLPGEEADSKREEIDPNELYAHGIVALLSNLDEGIQEHNISNQICKNDRQQVIGLRLADDKDKEVLVRLTGAEYPWEHITATLNGKEALDFTLEQTESSLQAKLRVTEEPEDPDSEQHSVELRYDDNTGRVEFSVDGKEANRFGNVALELVIKPEAEGVNARISVREEAEPIEEDYYGLISRSTAVDLGLTIQPMEGPVAPLSENPKDLLAMSREELEALLTEVEGRLDQLMGD